MANRICSQGRNEPNDTRAVTNVLNYALMLGIVSLVVSGLVFGVGAVVENQQERAIQGELKTIGNRLAEDVSTVDRLVAQNDGNGAVVLHTTLPEHVAGSGYKITVTETGTDRYLLVLESTDPEIQVRVSLRMDADLATGTVHGGELTIRYDDTADHVEVTDD